MSRQVVLDVLLVRSGVQGGVEDVSGLQVGDLVGVEDGLVVAQRPGQVLALGGVAEHASDLAVPGGPALLGRRQVVHVDVLRDRPAVHRVAVPEAPAALVGGVADRVVPGVGAAGERDGREHLAIVRAGARDLVHVVRVTAQRAPRRVEALALGQREGPAPAYAVLEPVPQRRRAARREQQRPQHEPDPGQHRAAHGQPRAALAAPADLAQSGQPQHQPHAGQAAQHPEHQGGDGEAVDRRRVVVGVVALRPRLVGGQPR